MKEMMFNEVFAERIRKERERLGLTKKEMSDKLDMYQATYSSIENGNAMGSGRMVDTARALNISLDYLTGLTDERKPIKETAAPAAETAETAKE